MSTRFLARGAHTVFTMAWTSLLLAVVASAGTTGDFNGDGYDDLAIGVPGEDVSGISNAGAVNFLFGSSTSLRPSELEILSQGASEVDDMPETSDAFGSALVMGDFDGDGYDDLAVGVPGEDLGSVNAAGAVQVFYGNGMATLMFTDIFSNEIWDQDQLDAADGAEAGDQFGAALAAGDFDGDGYDDLAVGAPGEDLHTPVDLVTDAGVVHVLYGGLHGLDVAGNRVLDASLLSSASNGTRFGSVLTAGDFDGDGRDDLAVGVPDADDAFVDAGTVRVFQGSSRGFANATTWSQTSSGVPGASEASDGFGFALAAGDFNGDTYDDLAIGVPFEDVGGTVDAGFVIVLYGSSAGLRGTGSDSFIQNPRHAPESETSDRFGRSLAAGDANADGFDELVVGAPGEDSSKGAVTAFRGRADGLVFLQLVRARVQGGAQIGDSFATALTLGDFDGNSRCEVIVGVPRDDVSTEMNAGSITLITPQFVRFFTQDSPLVEGTPGSNDGYGSSLSTGSP